MIGIRKAAVLSECGRFRYHLTRRWGDRPGCVTWIMLNPSTADASIDDPTIRRCMTFTERLGYQGLVVVNLFALRATNPKELLDAEDPVGPENPKWINLGCQQGKILIAAWGATKAPIRRGVNFIDDVIRNTGYRLKCLGTTKNNSPRHPVRLRADTPLVDWRE